MSLQSDLQATLGDGYTITRELSGGGMSRVFVARDVALNRDVAVKVLPEDLAAGVNVDRFRREILLAAALQHPNIVPVLSAGETNGLPYYTMPFVHGESLRVRLARGPLPMHEAVSLLREVARALAYAHHRGVVHRDIKPDNVLLSGGSAVVADFGIAKAISASRTLAPGATLTQVGTSIGTPAYMSPEQAAGDPATDHRADLYSLGCLAYEVLTGRPPFAERTPHKLLTAHMTETPRPVSELRPGVPRALSDLVAALLEKAPEARPQSAEDVISVLDNAVTPMPSESAPQILRGGRGTLWRALVAYAIAFVVIAVVAKAAIVGIGLPDWVFPGALVVMALGLPVILFTGYAHYATRHPTRGTMAAIALKASPHVSWGRAIWGGGLAIGAFVLVVGGYMLLRALGIGPAGSLLASGGLAAKDRIVIGDFTSHGPDSTLGSVVAEAVRADVGQSNVVTVMSPPSVTAALTRMQRPASTRLDLNTAMELAQREGAKAVLTGDIGPLGGGYIVTARLVRADSGITLASFRATADGPRDLLASLGKLTHDIRGKMGESLKQVHATPPLEQVTTSNLEALRLYAQATRANNVDGDWVKAVLLDQQALALDSTFASAWRGLGVALNNSGHPRAEVDSASARAFRYRSRLPARERLFAEAYYWSGAGRDRGKAAQAYEQMLAEDPRDFAALNNLGLLEASRRHFPHAESLFTAAYTLTGGATALGNVVASETANGRLADAESSVAVLRVKFPGSAPAQRVPATLLVAEQRYDSAAAVLARVAAVRSAPGRQFVLDDARKLATARGRLAEAERLAEARYGEAVAAHLAASPFDVPIILAVDAGWFNEDTARAAAILDSAIAAHPFKTLLMEQRRYLDISRVYAMAGRPDRGRAMLATYATDVRDTAQLRVDAPQRHRVLADILMAEKKGSEAIGEVRRGDTTSDGAADACELCMTAELGRAFDLAGQRDSARVTMERFVTAHDWNRIQTDALFLAGSYKRLGELYEAAGQRDSAVSKYSKFIELWKGADPSLQRKVAEVKQRLRLLASGEKR